MTTTPVVPPTGRVPLGARAQSRLSNRWASFAALVVPPHHSIDRASLEELMDVDLIKSRMEQAGEGQARQTWIDGCLRRLWAALSGRDIMFDDDEPG